METEMFVFPFISYLMVIEDKHGKGQVHVVFLLKQVFLLHYCPDQSSNWMDKKHKVRTICGIQSTSFGGGGLYLQTIFDVLFCCCWVKKQRKQQGGELRFGGIIKNQLNSPKQMVTCVTPTLELQDKIFYRLRKYIYISVN